MAGIFLRVSKCKWPTTLHLLSQAGGALMAPTPTSVPGTNPAVTVNLTLLSPCLTRHPSSRMVFWTPPLLLQCHIRVWISLTHRPDLAFFPPSTTHFCTPLCSRQYYREDKYKYCTALPLRGRETATLKTHYNPV